jgi:hypothetical protein
VVSRRGFALGALAGAGALVVGWGLLPPRQRLVGSAALPLAAGQSALNGWVKIGTDDRVTVMIAKSEMGQGVTTALAMLLADELDARWDQVSVESSPIDPIYNNVATVVDGLPFHPDDHGPVRSTLEWLTAKSIREFGLMVTGGSSSIKTCGCRCVRQAPVPCHAGQRRRAALAGATRRMPGCRGADHPRLARRPALASSRHRLPTAHCSERVPPAGRPVPPDRPAGAARIDAARSWSAKRGSASTWHCPACCMRGC